MLATSRSAPACFSGRHASLPAGWFRACHPMQRQPVHGRSTRRSLACVCRSDAKERINELEVELKLAIAEENYKKASELKKLLDEVTATLPKPQASAVEELKAQLQRAVEEERYEDAARLRDELWQLEESLKPPLPDRREFEALDTTSDTVTQGVRVKVQSSYVPMQSMPAADQYFFVYDVTITNESDQVVQVLSRHWHIKDAKGHDNHVTGPGVVGKQPVLSPGASFSYQSACPLRADLGSMEGEFTCVVMNPTTGAPDGPKLEVTIGRFALKKDGPTVAIM